MSSETSNNIEISPGFLQQNTRFTLTDGIFYAHLYTKSEDEADVIADSIGIECEIHNLDDNDIMFQGSDLTHCIVWKSSNAVDLSSKLPLKNSLALSPSNYMSDVPKLRYSLCHPDATPPSKTYVSDSGFDISLVYLKKEDQFGTRFYGTGVVIQPAHGMYMDLVARSSMSKTGHFIVNCVGIIDQSYRGEIIVALRKVSDQVPDLKLPLRIVQLIPRSWTHLDVVLDDIGDTTRGAGGFGSTS